MRFFTAEKIEKELRDVRLAVVREYRDIRYFKFWQAPFDAAMPDGAAQPDFDDADWADFRVGEAWGGYDITAWFRARAPIPREWVGRPARWRRLGRGDAALRQRRGAASD